MRFLLTLALLAACNTDSSIERLTSHFDPASGTVFQTSDASVHVVGLDDVDVCYSVDGSDPGYADTCQAKLDQSRKIALACGFQNIKIRWSQDDAAQEAAAYDVRLDTCDSDENTTVADSTASDANDTDGTDGTLDNTSGSESTDGALELWQNDELVRAFVAIKDELQCNMNDCKNPSLPGTWSTQCGDGSVTWEVSLNGLRAISVFTYENCRYAATIDVHDPADPSWQDPQATVALDVELVIDGEIRQDTDFSGNGAEAGTVAISGDFIGEITSLIEIGNKTRAGGGFAASCSEGPIANEICAPLQAAIRYDYPDWTCHTDLCPEAW